MQRLMTAPPEMIVRLLSYVRLLIEPMFAYNYFDEDEAFDIEEYDSESGSSSSDSEKADHKHKVKKKNVVIKAKGYEIKMKLEQHEIQLIQDA